MIDYSPDDLERLALAVLFRAVADVREGGKHSGRALAFLEGKGARWADELGIEPGVWGAGLQLLQEPPAPVLALPPSLLQQPIVSRPGARCELCGQELATWAGCIGHWRAFHAGEAGARVGAALRWLEGGGRGELRRRLELLAEARGCSYSAAQRWRASMIRGRRRAA